jgi:hypothetical protein
VISHKALRRIFGGKRVNDEGSGHNYTMRSFIICFIDSLMPAIIHSFFSTRGVPYIMPSISLCKSVNSEPELRE